MYRPATDVDGSIRSIEKFYEVIFERGAGIAAADIDLAKHDVPGRRRLALYFGPTPQTSNPTQEQTEKDQRFILAKGARY